MNVYNKILIDFKSSYMQMIPLSIIFQSCLGSVAALYILKNHSGTFVLQLGACVVICMAYNAAVLAQLKHKLVFNLLLISILANTLFIIFNT